MLDFQTHNVTFDLTYLECQPYLLYITFSLKKQTVFYITFGSRRDIVVGAENPRTGKTVAEKAGRNGCGMMDILDDCWLEGHSKSSHQLIARD